MGPTQTTDPTLQNAYDALPKGNCSRHHIESILRMRTSEYNKLVPTVEELLEENGVTGDQSLAGTAGEQTKQGIVDKLRDNSRYKTLLQKALDDYDEEEDIVNRAIGKLVLLVNAARKKRVKTKGKSHKNTINDAKTESPAKSEATSPAVTPASGVEAVPSVIETKPQEPLDVIISYEGSSKLVANLADLVDDENRLQNDESEITATDLSLARLIAKAVDMFEEVITVTEQISYFRCTIKGILCDIKKQSDLAGVARRAIRSNSDLHLEILTGKGRELSYRASLPHNDIPLHKSIEEDRGFDHTNQPTTPKNPSRLIVESESTALSKDGRTDNSSQPTDDPPERSFTRRIVRSEDSTEDREPKPIKTPIRSNAQPESTVLSKDRGVKTHHHQPYTPLLRKHKLTFIESDDSSVDGEPVLKKPRKGSLAGKGADKDSVMKEADGQERKRHEAESRERVSDEDVFQQEDEEGLIKACDEDHTTLCIPDVNPDEGLPRAVPIENLPPWEETDVDIDVGEVLQEKSYDEKDIPREDENAEAIGTAEMPIDVEIAAEPDMIDTYFDDDDVEGRAQRAILRETQLASRALEQRDPAEVKAMYRFFKHPPHKGHSIDPGDYIWLEGMRRGLQPTQAFAAFFHTKKARFGWDSMPAIGATINGDKMGFGKSATIAAIAMIERNLALAEDAIAKAQEPNSTTSQNHLPADAAEDRLCPTEPFAIACPCAKGSPSYGWKAKAGIQWFFTPPELATNAIEEWYKQVDPEAPGTGMRLLVETTIRDKRVELNLGPDSRPVKLYSLRTQPAEFQEIQRQQETGEGLQRFVVLASRQAWKSIKKRKLHEVVSAHVFRDEFHLEPSADNDWVKAMLSLPGKPYMTWFSGTPADEVKELFGWARVVFEISANNGAKKNSFWSQVTHEKLQRLALDASSKKELVQKQAMQTWSTLLRHVMIQRTRIALWDGQVIQHVPRMRWRLIKVTMDPDDKRHCARVLNLRSQIGEDGKISTTKLYGSSQYGKAAACASFPKLAKIITATDGKMGVTKMKELKLFSSDIMKRDNKGVRLSLIRKTEWWHKTHEAAPKMIPLLSILRKQIKDYYGRPGKDVILCFRNETACITHNILLDLGYKSVWYHAQLSDQEKVRIVRDFQTKDEEAMIIVGTATVLGTGRTLNRAQRLHLFEQVSSLKLWEQEVGRVLRFGNPNYMGVVIFEYFNVHSVEVSVRGRRDLRDITAKAALSEMLRQAEEVYTEGDEESVV